MTKKIFRSIVFVAVVTLAASLIFIFGVVYDYFSYVQQNQLKSEMMLAVKAVEEGGISYLQSLEKPACRLTWIDEDGRVIYDTQKSADTMDNHVEREEVQEALENGEGESLRHSSTLLEETTYYARRLSDNTVLRISVSTVTAPVLMIEMFLPILAVGVLAVILSFFLAKRLSARIVEPLNMLDLDRPLENNTYDELSPLLTHMEQQHKKIHSQRKSLKSRQDEFYAVIENMNEGLVMLNQKGIVLSMNPSAAAFFHVKDDSKGKSFITIERSHQIQKALEKAAEEGHSEAFVSREGKEYQLNVSRIESDKKNSGLVLLVFDVTEKVFAERNRKEFTANVSHELKTPLQAIMGSAELLESGIVKEADIPRFVGHIRKEAARLLALIEDIIRLSQLDEQNQFAMEEVDLFTLIKNQEEVLAPVALTRQVTMRVEGASTKVYGVRKLYQEVIYNLMENAIKYNVEGGHILVSLKQEAGEIVLRVEDTGIGIPVEHQSRVFERFYRVDKSHSKLTGGTGLGLSIVKHAVQYLEGRIVLESTPGEGTCITVYFPVTEQK